MNIGTKIKRLRTRKQMTQSELVGEQVSRNMLSLIENGKAVPSIQTLEALADKLKVSPALLLAEGEEETALLKLAQMKDIRIAYSAGNYRIAADLCRRLYQNGMAEDDEIDLVLAQSLFENAKEALLVGEAREACRLFDESVLYAKRTMYFSAHLIGGAWLYFEYLNMLSPSLVSENLDMYTAMPDIFPSHDVFCRYIRAILDQAEELSLFPEDPAYARLLNAHVCAKRHIRNGDFERAMGDLSEILRGEDLLPIIFMYHVFGDMEDCCRRVGNDKNADFYRDLKMSQFEKLLS